MTARTKAMLLLILMMFAAGSALAATTGTATNTVSPILVVNVTVVKAIQLTLATGSLGTTPCAITPASDYSMSFGTVDALGITAPTCGKSFAPTTPGVTPAAYYADYKLTPSFTSQTVSTNTITAYVSTNFARASLSVVEANSLPASIAGLSAMSTSSGSQTTVGTANGASGTAQTAYIGVEIQPTNGAGLTGADSATVTYTLTVQ